jgi:hypothetical protein
VALDELMQAFLYLARSSAIVEAQYHRLLRSAAPVVRCARLLVGTDRVPPTLHERVEMARKYRGGQIRFARLYALSLLFQSRSWW